MNKKLAIFAGAVLVFGAAFVLRESGNPASSGEDHRALASVSKPLPRLVDLGSDKCIPCKQMEPILEELRLEYQGSLVVEFIDVWKDPEAGKPFGVRVIPTQVFIDGSGVERFRHEGFLPKDAILSKWEELGIALTPNQPRTGS